MTAGVPFRLSTGELAADRTVLAKLTGGGDIHPRFEIDARVALSAGEGGAGTPGVAGNAKILFGPPAQVAAAGLPIPVTIQTAFKTAGRTVELEIARARGGGGRRQPEACRRRHDAPRRARSRAQARRQAARHRQLHPLGERAGVQGPHGALGVAAGGLPIDLDLSLASIGLAQEELSNFVLRAGLRKGRAEIQELAFVAPGQTRITAAGELGLTIEGGGAGRVTLATDATDRLLRYLGRLDIALPFANASRASRSRLPPT